MSKNKNKRKKSRHRVSKVGQRPGELIYTGQHKEEPIHVTWYTYNIEQLEKKSIHSPEKLPETTQLPGYRNWINISGLHNNEWVKQIGKNYNIHNLTLEDALNVNHTPKVDIFDHYVFVTLKMILPQEDGSWSDEHISFILQDQLVLSFQEKEADVFLFLRTRLEDASGKIRQRGVDYLLYALIDVVIDNYFIVTNRLTDNLYQIQEDLIVEKQSLDQQTITQLHNDWIRLRQIILPFKTAFSKLNIAEETPISPDTAPFLHDLSDHLQQLSNELRMQQDLIQSIVNHNMANLGYSANVVMKKLTVIATIFIPLTFIAGVYGMNFDNMPELHWEYGYLFVWIVMIATAITMIWYLKKLD